MKCIYCGKDSKYKERSAQRCPGCGKSFAFEPQNKDPFTDAAFKSAIDAVSANGHVRWGVEHLYYELCRRILKRKRSARYFFIPFVPGSIILLVSGLGAAIFLWAPICVGVWLLLRRYDRSMLTVRLDQFDFDRLWNRWLAVHGSPQGLIVRQPKPDAPRAREADIGDYSFDRAVICDRARTVDMLIANNFHFENNCAVLSIGGYPEGPFELVRSMLKKNPKLQVFALHDASVNGCKLAHTLANDEHWFKGRVAVTDVGLRPGHSQPFRGLFLPARAMGPLAAGDGILAEEVEWLNSYALELAAIRPEQVLKRLFKAINRREEAASSDGGAFAGGDGYYSDTDSFSSTAGDSDGGADSFG